MKASQKRFFRDQLRAARAIAQEDAEGFQALVQSLELIGQLERGKAMTLAGYKKSLGALAKASPLYDVIPSHCPAWHTPFEVLYEELRQARNAAVHQGAYARILTDHAVDLAIVLEDALMKNAAEISQFMVRNVIEAKAWHPVSFVRQQMLRHAFTYIPIQIENEWLLIPDFEIARYLRTVDETERNARLACSLTDATKEGG